MVYVRNLSLKFGDQTLFEEINLSLSRKDWVSMLGTSGVGKSTLLRLIAGIETQGVIQGSITFEPNIRLAWLPQKDTLYPWLSLVDNVQLQAVLLGQKSAKTTEQAKMLLEKVGMAEHLHKNCSQLSGGQRQRVALARTLMQNADLILLDEPFSALDAISRYELQNLAYELLKEKSVLLVTHDPQEALRLSQRIFVMRAEPSQPATLSAPIIPTGNAPREFNHTDYADLWALQQQLVQALSAEGRL
ncbi:ABC transporter ATP-binding protein [Rodentibacter trehalosifermentans]|uniref:Phosphonate ABC transporter ATP-binding protein n=1 Tax=Rodentibacter trehalosifermentans TaxID=1908263 RepID=A0A1V3INP7_9PAST|nr:ABC transporter ATP-binding protein [Rodentibacter trehalosifermentans]OOF43858.1 phosphonate ABC transporter ATP-binding protein [Rodentibacter trehalosifermentans]OOF47164.1 phosphonate ABC transporter ATP-binding protein [Rodentibacter trehalosifermentans]OOF49093.1 phosphonate ABC transporter ATP-binding protein [Rodentibacter trehalosifermentans]